MSPLPLSFERGTPHLLTRGSGEEAPIETLFYSGRRARKGAQRGGLQEGAPSVCVHVCFWGRQAQSRGAELRPEPLPRKQT